MPQLNFQQSEYQTGRLAQFDVVNCPPDRQRAVSGVVQEWISHELGLARLEDGGVALFHVSEVWTLVSSWVPYSSVVRSPPSQDYLAALNNFVLALVTALIFPSEFSFSLIYVLSLIVLVAGIYLYERRW